MSYQGFEYGSGGSSYGFGGFDPMGSGGFGSMDAGGGFVDNMGMGGTTGSSNSRPTERKANREKQSVIPLSIKQIDKSVMEDDTVRIDGVEIFLVRIMGNIESVDEHSTSMNYQVNDGTGSIECKQWLEKEGGARQLTCTQGMFVRVHGVMRHYENKKHILVYDIRKVENFNELTHHLLETILVHLEHTRGPIPGSTGSSVVTASSQSNTPSYNMGLPGGSGFTPQSGGVAGGAINLNSTIKSERKEDFNKTVLNLFVQKSQGDGGLSDADCIDILGRAGHPRQQVLTSIDVLTENGLLYTTYEGWHKPTEMNGY